MSLSRRPRYLQETALIVNSQSSEREVLQHFFAEADYHVLTSSTNEEAMEHCRNYTGAIHLLVTDEDRGESSGWMLAEAAAKVRPGLLVLFLSAASLKNSSSELIPKKPPSSALANVVTSRMLMGITHLLSHRSQAQKWRN
jgi:DNA-binding NtrC family response regulator